MAIQLTCDCGKHLRAKDELAGKRVRLTVIEESPPPHPNEAMLAVMRQVAEAQKGMRFTSGEDTQRLLREARSGRMYGDESDE